MSTESNLSPRPYRGVAQAERQLQRRDQLIAAAIQVYGERGYRNASVKAVCEAAGLTERYFYESFGNSDELLVASFNAVSYGVQRESIDAARSKRSQKARTRAMLHAYFSALQREPNSARVFLVEIRGVSPAVDEAFEQALRAINLELKQVLGLNGKHIDDLFQLGVLGGVIQIASSWVNQGYQPAIDAVTETALRLASVMFDAAA